MHLTLYFMYINVTFSWYLSSLCLSAVSIKGVVDGWPSSFQTHGQCRRGTAASDRCHSLRPTIKHPIIDQNWSCGSMDNWYLKPLMIGHMKHSAHTFDQSALRKKDFDENCWGTKLHNVCVHDDQMMFLHSK